MSGCRPLQGAEVVEVAQSFGGRYALRDRALFLVGLYTGFRITELLTHGSPIFRVVWENQHTASYR